MILIDDARVTTERRAGPSATFLNPFALEHVEVVRGPGSVSYGSDAIGGIIHARTPRPSSDDVAGRVELGVGTGQPFGSVAAEVNAPVGKAGILAQVYGRSFGDYETPNGTQPIRNQGRRRPQRQVVVSEMRPINGSVKASTMRPIQGTAPARVPEKCTTSVR